MHKQCVGKNQWWVLLIRLFDESCVNYRSGCIRVCLLSDSEVFLSFFHFS